MLHRQLLLSLVAALACQSKVSAILTVDTSSLKQTHALKSCVKSHNCEVNIHTNGKDWSAGFVNGTKPSSLGKRANVINNTDTSIGSAGVYIGQLDPQTLISSLPCHDTGCDATAPVTINKVEYVVDNGWTSPKETGKITVTADGLYQGTVMRDALLKVIAAGLQTTGCTNQTARENCNRREGYCSKVYQIHTCMAPSSVQAVAWDTTGGMMGHIKVTSVFTETTSQEFLCNGVIDAVIAAVSALEDLSGVGAVLGVLDAAECT